MALYRFHCFAGALLKTCSDVEIFFPSVWFYCLTVEINVTDLGVMVLINSILALYT